jgi:hypothetical protein
MLTLACIGRALFPFSIFDFQSVRGILGLLALDGEWLIGEWLIGEWLIGEWLTGEWLIGRCCLPNPINHLTI